MPNLIAFIVLVAPLFFLFMTVRRKNGVKKLFVFLAVVVAFGAGFAAWYIRPETFNITAALSTNTLSGEDVLEVTGTVCNTTGRGIVYRKKAAPSIKVVIRAEIDGTAYNLPAEELPVPHGVPRGIGYIKSDYERTFTKRFANGSESGDMFFSGDPVPPGSYDVIIRYCDTEIIFKNVLTVL